MRRRKRNIVYSTDPDFEKNKKRGAAGSHRRAKSLPPAQQTAYIRREKKGRGGKIVTVIRELQLTAKDLKALGKKLKKRCGAGGTVKNNTIEIQGDHRDKIAAELQKMGYKTKFVGG